MYQLLATDKKYKVRGTREMENENNQLTEPPSVYAFAHHIFIISSMREYAINVNASC